jgi:macrolide transport system ATP-binding/permease protein
MNIIEIKKLNKFFGSEENRIHVLKDIDLDIVQGDFVAIMGQSGSGKTTLMNIIGCLDNPTSGSCRLFDVPIDDLNRDQQAKIRSRNLGFVFQRYNLLPNLTVLDNVALPAVYIGLDQSGRLERARDLLSRLNISEKLLSLPHQLSGGQQQRVSIARALMNGGQIILADEPTGALDSQSGQTVMEILSSLHEAGQTVILVTHDREIAAKTRRVVEIKDGRIISDTRRLPKHEPQPTKSSETAQTTQTEARNITPLVFYRKQFFEAFKMSLQAIRSHSMRSLLTMLGIIIGIASVISVVALARGSQERILANINSMGTNTITVYRGTSFSDPRRGQIRTLTVTDAEVLSGQYYLAGASPIMWAEGYLSVEGRSVWSYLAGVGDQYLDVRGLKIVQGRGLTVLDIRDGASVVVLDHKAAKELFPEIPSPLGQTIFFRKRPLKVVGVTSPVEETSGPQGYLNLWAPYTTVMYKVGGEKYITSIVTKVADSINPQSAEISINALLTARHDGRKDFFAQNSDTIRQTAEKTTATMTLLISSIGFIALLVGGIGVMNIMLVSVTERTREIGIRMAVGARSFHILGQFLIEAILLCLIGGLAGIALSGMVGFAFNKLTQDFYMSFAYSSIILGLVSSSLIGITFGFLPARKASRLNPIDALAFE